MKNVVALQIVDTATNKTIAIMHDGEEVFSDPHGGTFSSEEQWSFRCVATGVATGVWLHRGTKFEKRVSARLETIFI